MVAISGWGYSSGCPNCSLGGSTRQKLEKLNPVLHFFRFVEVVDEQQGFNGFAEGKFARRMIHNAGKRHAACQAVVSESKKVPIGCVDDPAFVSRLFELLRVVYAFASEVRGGDDIYVMSAQNQSQRFVHALIEKKARAMQISSIWRKATAGLGMGIALATLAQWHPALPHPLNFLAMIIEISEGGMNLGEGQMRMGGKHFIGGHAQLLDFQSNALHTDPCTLNMELSGAHSRVRNYVRIGHRILGSLAFVALAERLDCGVIFVVPEAGATASS